uniref:EF-hand domain-containing protein n=1 Tax=Echinostoma caproni TaxID=27848 RepID=A0A183B445_9TREM
LDVNKDGKICSSDIMRVLEELHGSFLMRCGGARSGYVTFPEFVDYVLEHDKCLVTAFDLLGQSKSGRLTRRSDRCSRRLFVCRKSSGKQLLQLTAGAIAGAVSRTCTAPVDRLKLMRQVHDYKHKGSRFIEFVAGFFAGFTPQTIIYPLEVMKTRKCLRKSGQFSSVWDCARAAYRENGLLAFYRGYFINLLGIVPYARIELALYERCESAYVHRFMVEDMDSCGGVIPVLAEVSSTCGIVDTYTASLVCAKLQADFWTQTKQQKVTVINLVKTICREDGLYRGLVPISQKCYLRWVSV